MKKIKNILLTLAVGVYVEAERKEKKILYIKK